jgi:hypothetical protein
MAAAVLVLEVPQKVTLEATATNLRKLTLPAGARYLEYSSANPWFIERAAQATADAAAGTATAQQRVDAGTGSWRVPQSGSGRARLQSDLAIFLAGSTSAQDVWLTATARGV